MIGMKKYVFFTFAVSGIGGTQIYVRNKLRFLKKQGWEVVVITVEPKGDIYIKDLEPFHDFSFPEFNKNPFLFTKKKRAQLIDKIKYWIGPYDKIIIESNFPGANVWGELVAKELHAKHFVFLIIEDYSLSDKRYMNFYNFKFERRELAANTLYALSKLFEGFRSISDKEKYHLHAICSNSIEVCESEHEAFIIDADYHIGSVGRLNKPFVHTMVHDVCSFVEKYPNKTFQLVLFGYSPNTADIEKIQAAVNDVPNLSAYITGPIFPIPAQILNKMDVFVSSSGAASSTANLGYVTIAIDGNDFMPTGILRHTTTYSLHRDPLAPRHSTEELLQQVLMDQKFHRLPPINPVGAPNFMETFKTHMEFINSSSNEPVYYNMNRLRPKWLRLLIYRILHR